MTQVSKYPIAKDIEKRMFDIFTKVIADLRSSSDINEFISEFLSPGEKIMLAKRLSIAVLLARGYQYRDISKILKVSPPTIAQVAVNIKYAGKGYKRIVEKIIKSEETEEFWHKISDLFEEIVPPKGRDWSTWKKERKIHKYARRRPF